MCDLHFVTRCVTYITVCSSNCKKCTTNLASKCDSGQCDSRYYFDSATKTCSGL